MLETIEPVYDYHLRLITEKHDGEAPDPFSEDEIEEKLKENDEKILCRQCRQVVTTETERITIRGFHLHTFANPHGYIFQIGCFRSAGGCGYTGPVTEEWSWFKGFHWRVAVCNMCLIQLGWRFTSTGGDHFNGLILNRLISENEQHS